MAKAGFKEKEKKPTEVDLLPRMLHLASGMKPISAKAYGDMMKADSKDTSGKALSAKDKAEKLKAEYTKFDPAELEQIRAQKLYLCLPEPARTELYKLVSAMPPSPAKEVSPAAASAAVSSSSNPVEPLPPTTLVTPGDKMGMALAYLALANGDEPLLQNFSQSLAKSKQLFGVGENIEGLKAYVHNYKIAKLGFKDDRNCGSVGSFDKIESTSSIVSLAGVASEG